MSTLQINSPGDVYRFVDRLELECQKSSEKKLLDELRQAKHLGSSALEIMGALRQTILSNLGVIQKLLGIEGEKEAFAVVGFINKAFGR